jgi:hypothetical protein
MHTPPFWSTMGLTMLAGLMIGVVAAGIAWPFLPYVSGLHPVDQAIEVGRSVAGALATAVIPLMIYIAIVRAIVTSRRQSHFQKKVVPVYTAFLRGYDPVIPDVTKA